MAAGRPQGFTTALTDIDTTPQEYLGVIREEYKASYKYVRFSGTLAVAAGDPCCYVITDTTFVTVDGTNSVNGAGIATAAHPAGSVSYGWIQVAGLSNPITTLTSGTAGQPVTNTGAGNAALVVAAAITNQVVGVVANAAARTIMLSYPM
jgi:hypothetical protein